ncbi:ferric reductase-like transmembrane domain-containing protein [Pseudonocardia sp.]|uniref:ferredoxin reductase family protein n=1 Tax=Pseudonocardia sp. TaxID=60912 RepID=UPI0031FD5242
MKRSVAHAAWVTAFVALPLVPVALLFGTGEERELGVAVVLGLVAISALVGTIVVASRLRSLTSGLGMEQLLVVHRSLGLVVLGLVLAHIAVVIVPNPRRIALLDLAHAKPGMRAATIATIALLLLALTALLRRWLQLPYQLWRIAHLTLAATAVAGSALHVILQNHLLNDDGMRVWFAAITGSLIVVLILRWCLRPLLAGRAGFRVREVRPESDTVSTLVLAASAWRRSSHRDALGFAPGQFAWLRLRRWSLLTDHPFTIASGARADGTLEFTVRHLGDYTQTLGRLSPGTRVYLDGPHGSFSVDHTRATGLVLLAGGVGITPMMSMLRTLADRGDRRPHRLLVSGRSPDDLLFTDELEDLQARLHLTVVPTLTQPHPGWTGATGRIDAAMLATVLPGSFRRDQLDYFLCGSSPFVNGVVTALDEIGIPRQRIHTEQFDMA